MLPCNEFVGNIHGHVMIVRARGRSPVGQNIIVLCGTNQMISTTGSVESSGVM
jgi:hypothetical protein